MIAKVLVTGAYGQLGHEVKAFSAHSDNFDFEYTDFDTLDITNEEAVVQWFEQNRPAFVVNCAAYTAVDKAEEDPENAFRLNSRGPENLARASAAVHARMIHISTDYVFDGTSCRPYHEKDLPNPSGVYGFTKLQGEQLAVAADSSVVIIRTSWLYSSFGNNFVKTMLRLGLERDSLKVVFDQVGTPTYAGDLAAAIVHILNLAFNDISNWKPGIYHYSNEGVCSWYDFAAEIHRKAGISCHLTPVESKDFPTLAKRPSYSVLNKEKIKSTYHLQIPWWRSSLEKCIDLIQNKPL